MANVGNQLPTQAVSKPAPGKHGNVLPLWGNEKTMNLNPMILTNVLSSPYFKVQLYELKTYHEVVDEIYFKVTLANAKPHATVVAIHVTLLQSSNNKRNWHQTALVLTPLTFGPGKLSAYFTYLRTNI